eukprot:1155839-Pelagomonas_calceolata.AAC.12
MRDAECKEIGAAGGVQLYACGASAATASTAAAHHEISVGAPARVTYQQARHRTLGGSQAQHSQAQHSYRPLGFSQSYSQRLSLGLATVGMIRACQAHLPPDWLSLCWGAWSLLTLRAQTWGMLDAIPYAVGRHMNSMTTATEEQDKVAHPFAQEPGAVSERRGACMHGHSHRNQEL